ncbi:putative N6-adenine methyltransferase-domain-containing protein [Protomyces lactucae-debilis]|uniref:Protein-lysine N-methyltransferase EFM5 n=1 Tax=Protomyces lactucae-debilis TaxID=2754530 RepID=A0A1Y2F1Y0_PROLT|nr:putative N6-adenine methyltransferase-domain-containing protein [Protomyces lactucae-debilis]ORY77707.1 putative N6-adenine methyltransferase-domain-containing protein [Protomyces lactucae-debilis]
MDDDPITLSLDTLNALKEFQSEQQAEKERFAALEARAQARFQAAKNEQDTPEEAVLPSIHDFKEDWQLSQFWYSPETADALAGELLAGIDKTASSQPRVGVLCAPSVYPDLLKRNAQDAWLFEYDTRFELLAHDKFVKYDYKHPFQLPPALKGTFDRLIIDPPFLQDDCEIKAASTARWLGKPDCRFIVCSGAKMRDLLLRLYKAEESQFQVAHSGGRLSNDFMCLLNYKSTDPQFASLASLAKEEYALLSQTA